MPDTNTIRSVALTALLSLLAFAAALAVGAVLIWLSGDDPVEAYRAMIEGAFGDKRAIAETLVATTPYIFGGLAFAVAFRSGMFNIGIEGQMVMGGLAAALFGAAAFDLPAVIYLPLALLIAAIAGGLWGAIAGALKAISGAHEVVTTIMLNYIAYRILTYTVLETEDWLPVQTEYQATKEVADAASLPNIWDGTRLHAGLILGIISALVIWLLLFRTTFGYRLRTTGLSRGAAVYAGIPVGLTLTLAMFASGALAGLGGASESIGLLGRQYGVSSGFGFTAIAVGLVGRNNPLGILGSAFLFGVLRNGSNEMQNVAGTSKELVYVLQGLVILAMALIGNSDTVRSWWARRKNIPTSGDDYSSTIGVESPALES